MKRWNKCVTVFVLGTLSWEEGQAGELSVTALISTDSRQKYISVHVNNAPFEGFKTNVDVSIIPKEKERINTFWDRTTSCETVGIINFLPHFPYRQGLKTIDAWRWGGLWWWRLGIRGLPSLTTGNMILVRKRHLVCRLRGNVCPAEAHTNAFTWGLQPPTRCWGGCRASAPSLARCWRLAPTLDTLPHGFQPIFHISRLFL